MSKRTSQEATVHMGSQGSSLLGQILVKGRASLNRAIHGDTVAGTRSTHHYQIALHYLLWMHNVNYTAVLS